MIKIDELELLEFFEQELEYGEEKWEIIINKKHEDLKVSIYINVLEEYITIIILKDENIFVELTKEEVQEITTYRCNNNNGHKLKCLFKNDGMIQELSISMNPLKIFSSTIKK